MLTVESFELISGFSFLVSENRNRPVLADTAGLLELRHDALCKQPNILKCQLLRHSAEMKRAGDGGETDRLAPALLERTGSSGIRHGKGYARVLKSFVNILYDPFEDQAIK